SPMRVFLSLQRGIRDYFTSLVVEARAQMSRTNVTGSRGNLRIDVDKALFDSRHSVTPDRSTTTDLPTGILKNDLSCIVDVLSSFIRSLSPASQVQGSEELIHLGLGYFIRIPGD